MNKTQVEKCAVRPTTLSDQPEIIRLMKQYYDFYQVAHPEEKKIKTLLNTLVSHPERGVQFIAKINEISVGFATLYSTFSSLQAQPAMVMNDLFVDPKYRKKGVGEALYQCCRTFTKENGYAFMEWVTANDNIIAQRFYEKQGAKRSMWISYSID